MTLSLHADRQGSRPRAVKWWDIDLGKKITGWSDARYASRYYELFEDAVRLRLRSDVPVGSCLSGGLDSSGIVCVVDDLLRRSGGTNRQKTFTATSDVGRFDESSFARAVIRSTRVEPFFVLPTPERLLDQLGNLIWHQDEPFLSTSIFAGWCVYHLARTQGVPVTLDGQGPDEMLGGYVPFAFPSLLADHLAQGRLPSFIREILALKARAGLGYGDMIRGTIRALAHGAAPRAWMPSVRRAHELFTDDFFHEGRRASVFLQELSSLPEWNARLGGSRFDRYSYALTTRDTLPGILRQVDRNAMAFSVEARLPFLDYRLVEYTFSLPASQRLRLGVSKSVYRMALKSVLPGEVRDRVTKLGFVTAEPEWIKGTLRPFLREGFDRLDQQGPFRRERVQQELTRYLDGSSPFSTTLWKIFCTQRWMDQNGMTGKRNHEEDPA